MAFDKVNIQAEQSNLSFLGRGWGFPVLFNSAMGTVDMVSDFTDISQSLYILFGVVPGERVTQLLYGCDIFAHIFDPMNSNFEMTLKDIITRAIDDFEPRIDIVSIDFNKEHFLEGVLYIELHYLVRATNTRHNIVFPFYKNEGTSLPDSII